MQVISVYVSNGSVNSLSTYKIKSILLLTLDFAADSCLAVKWFEIIYCRIGWQLTSDESWNTELMNSRSESNILTRLFFYSPARQRETVDENVKAPHNCDWTATIHVITNEYLKWMLLLLSSDYSAMKKVLKLNRFLAKVWTSRHKIYIAAISTHLVLELCNNKNLRYWFKATLTLETRIVCIFNTHG